MKCRKYCLRIYEFQNKFLDGEQYTVFIAILSHLLPVLQNDILATLRFTLILFILSKRTSVLKVYL